MKPPVEILIPNYNGYEALELCLLAIQRRTAYPNYSITVLNNPGDGRDAIWLRKMAGAGDIRLLETAYDRKPGESMYDLIRNSESDWVCHVESDVEVMSADWLSLLMGQIHDVGRDVAVARWFQGWHDEKAITVPVWGPEVMLLNLRLYRPFLEVGDFQQKSIYLVDYKYLDRLPKIIPADYKGYINLDTCWRFTEKVTYENPDKFRVAHIPAGYFGIKVRHYGGLSTRGGNPEIAYRWALVRERLARLRREAA